MIPDLVMFHTTLISKINLNIALNILSVFNKTIFQAVRFQPALCLLSLSYCRSGKSGTRKATQEQEEEVGSRSRQFSSQKN